MDDGKTRCFGSGKDFYAHYHDTEWGVPVHDDRHLFEMLILEGAQAGLSWETVLKKRAQYKRLFHDFDIARCAALTDAELEAILTDSGIVRNRLKVFSVRKNALAYQAIQTEYGSFDDYLWAYVDGQPIDNCPADWSEVPTSTPLSDLISKDLKKRGMSFVGSTIIYAYLQGVGVVNDHLADCWCRQT